jgi:DNA-binding NarL/FixJ family response regulator
VLPDSATSRAIQRLKDVGVAAGFVVVAHNPSYARGFGLLAAGASCAASNASAADLVEVVRLAARGTNLFVASNGERWGRARPSEAELSRLTKREWEVLSLLVAGASYPVVAEELGLGLRTVQTHAQRVLEKLEIRDKRQLVGVRLDDLRRVSANAQRPVWQAV